MRIDNFVTRPFPSSTSEIFVFAPDGTSSRPIEVLNFRREHNSNRNFLYRFDTVAVFNGKSLVKNPLVKYSFYDSNGFQVRI